MNQPSSSFDLQLPTNLAGATKVQKIGSWDEGENVIEQKLNGHIGKRRHCETGNRVTNRKLGEDVVDSNQ
jgi:hypothetical protein